MIMKDFSKDILHTIEERDIAPLPRWIFLMRQTALLGGFVLSVLIGGVSVSVILFALGDIDPGAERMIRMHPGPFLITYLPYVWVLTMIAFGIIAYYDMRSIKGAYRYRAVTILSASIVASIIVGGVLHTVGAGRIAERRFADVVPQYQAFETRKMHLWMRPEDGMLAGVIVSGSATSTLVLEDFSGIRWTVDVSDAVQRGWILGDFGERVRVAGSLTGPAVFHATDIFPWTRRGSVINREQGMIRDEVFSRRFPDESGQQGMMLRERNLHLAP